MTCRQRHWTRRGMRPLSLVFVAGLIVAGDAVHAQTVFGVTIDEIVETPIGLVSLEFTPTSGDRSAVQVYTGSDGGFRADLPGPGDYYFRADHLGYEPVLYGPIEVSDGSERIELIVEMRPKPAILEGISVEVRADYRSRYLERNGVYHRARTSIGRFLMPEDLEDRRFSYASIFRGIPGVRVANGDDIRMLGRGSGQCRPFIYVDGTELFSGFGLRGAVPLQDVDAVEIYRGASVPAQYRGVRGRPCGVILFWTRG